MNEATYIRGMRWVVIIASIILVALILIVWVSEGFFSAWKKYQDDYADLLTEMESFSGVEESQIGEIFQLNLEALGRIDRCITCHNGLENPFLSDSPQPHRTHPGNHLVHHPVTKFGCTVCHGGQGRALEKDEAFGRDSRFHWPSPLLAQPYIQSSCGKCHLAIYNESRRFEGTGVFYSGKEVFSREGCLGCHKARGVGGILGPDLTEQGNKSKHEYSFQNIKGEQTISNWLKEHFRDPEMVSPGSQMLKMDLPEEELDELVTFVLGLAKPDIPFDYFSAEALREFKGERDLLAGEQVFSFSCTACHGKQGRGKDYAEYKTGVPGVLNRDFLRMASAEYLYFTLIKGRSNRQMASWAPDLSGWKDTEIDSILLFISDHKSQQQGVGSQSVAEGMTSKGMQYYAIHCKMCHGEEGAGGIGIPIHNSDFLAVASDRFLVETIRNGRNNTAMPSRYDISRQEMIDLIAYIRSWGNRKGIDYRLNLPAGNIETGSLKYHYLCSRCHGEFGEGDTGPSNLNRNFLLAASDSYLYETISKGRSNTAMFGWSVDVHGDERLDDHDISDLIAFMKSTINLEWNYIHAGSNPGNAYAGQHLFRLHCAGCHGENGEGTEAPALHNQEFLSAASNGYLTGTISLGRSETKMPSWGRGEVDYPALTGKERQDITAYIRSWQRVRIRKE